MTADERIDLALQRFERARRRRLAAAAAMSGTALAVAWLLTAAVADRWLHVGRPARCATAGTAAAVLVVITVRTLWLAVRPYDVAAAARRVEASDPRWGERLLTVVSQSRLPASLRGSPELNAALASAVAEELDRHRQSAGRAALRSAAGLLSCVVGVGLMMAAVPWLDLPRLVARQVLPLADLPPVTSTRIDLLAHPSDLPQGRSLAVVADLTGDGGPATLWFDDASGPPCPLAMQRTFGQRYSVTLLAPQSDFTYRVTAGDATVGPVRVHVTRRPGVSATEIRLAYPEAFNRPPVTLHQTDGRLRVPAGTRVTVTMRITEPVRGVAVHVGDQVYSAKPDGGTWQTSFNVDASADWSIELTGREGIDGVGPNGMRFDVGPVPSPVVLNGRGIG